MVTLYRMGEKNRNIFISIKKKAKGKNNIDEFRL